MLTRYDPDRAPDPRRWLAADEDTRHYVVRRYHRRAGIKLPDEMIHAAFHVAVENQVAMGDETPVAAALERLMAEGLSRHDALHAIGSVLAKHMWQVSKGEVGPDVDVNEAYFADVKVLTAQSWRDEYWQKADAEEGG